MQIILVCLKNKQDYITDCIHNLKLFENNDIVLLTDIHEYIENFKDVQVIDVSEYDLNYFDNKNRLNNEYRNGFWTLTSKRLFYVYEYMKKYNVTSCFHIENDIMVYTNLSELPVKLDKIHLTIDDYWRCIPGIMFIPNTSTFKMLVDMYNMGKNDMWNCGNFFREHRNLCEPFPIIKRNIHYDFDDIFSLNYDHFNCIFDAAAIGQYLGGIDTMNVNRNTIGFINERCNVNYSHYHFVWKKCKRYNVNVPYIQIDTLLIRIVNLHIHSKNLKNFISY